LRGRVRLHQARYRHAHEELGRVWIAVDGEERAAFATGARWRHVREAADRLMDEREAWGSPAAYEQAVADAAETARQAGIYGDEDVLNELEAYLSLPVDAALASTSPLLRALAVLDARVGKRRLRELASAPDEHPLVTALLRLRCDAEGVRFAPPAA
jgi:beta-phosphoglucomutase-like phosphatase (HAD superfamily)